MVSWQCDTCSWRIPDNGPRSTVLAVDHEDENPGHTVNLRQTRPESATQEEIA